VLPKPGCSVSATRRMRRGVAGAGFLEDRTLVFLVQANLSVPGSVHRGERHTEEKSHLAIRLRSALVASSQAVLPPRGALPAVMSDNFTSGGLPTSISADVANSFRLDS